MGRGAAGNHGRPSLRTRLAAALGDPSLRLFRLNGGRAGDWVDELGKTLQRPQTAPASHLGGGRREAGARPMLVHDASLDYDRSSSARAQAFTLIT